jgi:site-specific DNA-methyltransferase (adenine-specific)
MEERYKLYQGDCLEAMDKLIKEGIKFDAIITDPPYGTTACKWDEVIPFKDMWNRINKLIKPNGAIVLFGNEPFSSKLRISNIKNYRYDWVWEKTRPQRFVQAKKMPLSYSEYIHIFYNKLPTYNPQMREGKPYIKKHVNSTKGVVYGAEKRNGTTTINKGTRYPSNIIKFSNPNKNSLHPTQKPVDLLEYLIRTYTDEGDLVLDFTMGSGSTGVACLNTNRKFVGIELDEKYFRIAKKRIEEALTDKGDKNEQF